jgi:hypothetical protein
VFVPSEQVIVACPELAVVGLPEITPALLIEIPVGSPDPEKDFEPCNCSAHFFRSRVARKP